jgi:hypothetical protein
MGGRNDSSRVQLFASTKRAVAESFRSEVRQWWSRVKGQAPTGVFGADLVLTIRYDGTYHQVLMGGFAVRSEAQQGRAFLRRRYPDASIVRTGGASDTLRRLGGWDVGPGLDGDLTLKVRKLGLKVVHAPDAVCYTNVPTSLSALARQRY